MFFVTYAAAFLAVVFAVSGVRLLVRKREPIATALGWYTLSAALWIGGNAVADVTYTEPSLIIASGLAFIGGAANLFCFLFLVDAVLTRRFPSPRRFLAYALPNLIVSAFAFSEFAIVDTTFPPGRPAEITPGPLYLVSLFLLLGGLTYAVIRFYGSVHDGRSGSNKKQIIYCLSGVIALLLGEFVFDVLLPLLGETRFYTLGPLFSLAFIACVGYSILRHKLVDLRLVIALLERKVEARTHELHRLQETQRRMMIDLSHNLQTPLAILKNKVARFERTVVRDSEDVSLEQSIDSLSGFVTDLLAVANLDESMRVEPRERFSLSELVDEVAEETSVIADADGITVEHNIQPELCMVGNRKRLREAVMNLAANAVKYIRTDTERTITFTLTETTDGITLVVRDTGIGIGTDDLPHIFERFYRGVRTYGVTRGTGLGLSIVERIVTDHGGSISAQSELGVGSVFTMRLPQP